MTLHRLPESSRPLTTDERLDNIDARIDVLIDGIKAILSDVEKIKARFGIDQ